MQLRVRTGSRTSLLAPKHAPRLNQRFCELVNFLKCVVEVEAGPRAGIDPQTFVQRHGAMVPRADRHSLTIQQLGDVVRVHPLKGEADDSCLVPGCGPQEPDFAQFFEPLMSTLREHQFMGMNPW